MPIFKAQYCAFLNSWVDNFLVVLRKSQINYFSKTSLNGYFKLTSDIPVKSVLQQGWKIKRENHGAKHWKIWFFFHYFNSFNKSCGWRGGLLYFIGKLCKYVSGKLEYKLQTAVPVLWWCFFNLNEKTVVKNEKKIVFNS